MSGESLPSARTCDLLVGGLLLPVVVLDGAMAVVSGAVVLTPGTSPPAPRSVPALVSALFRVLPVGGGLLRAVLSVLVAGAVTAAAAALAARSASYAGAVVVGVPVAAAYAVTGAIVEWDPFGYQLARTLLELCLSVPAVGEALAGLLFGGVTVTRATLRRAFLLHYALVGLLALVAVGALVPRRYRRRLAARFA